MERPRRTRSLQSARLALSTLSPTSPQSAHVDDVPEVLERSQFRLSDVKLSAQGIRSKGVLVKLFLVSRKGTRSTGDSEHTVWVVGSPDATNWTPRKSEEAQKVDARATDKASHAAKAWSTSKTKRYPTKVRRNVAEQPIQVGHIELEDTSDEQEEEEDEEEEDNAEDDTGEDDAGEDDAGEDDAGEDDAGDDDAGEDEDLEEEEAEEDGDLDEEAVVDDENGHDTEEQDGDGYNKASEEIGKEGEREAEGQLETEEQQEAERQQKAERGGEREGEEKTCEETEPHSETRGIGCAIHDGEEEEHGGNWEVGKEQGDQDQVQGVESAVGQRATINNRYGTWRSWKTADTNGEEDEVSRTNSDEEERTARDENGGAGIRRKRALEEDEAIDDAPLQEHPNKRSKTDRGENEDDAAKNDSLSRTNGLETQTRPRTPSLKSTTPSSPKTIEMVRQVSVVPALEGTESAVWDAARRNAVFTSLSGADQKKMVCTAVSHASEKGIKELQRFVCDTRRNLKQNGKSLESEFDLSASQSDADTRNADGTLIPRDSGLARLTALYHQITTLDNTAIKLSVTRRVKLAAMVQHRKSLLQEGAGRKQAKAANLRLFRAIHPEHTTIERPDEATKSVAHDDWQRLRDRLREGRRWLDIRDLFGGAGAFLALPSQCVSDRYVQKMQAEKFDSWLLLLDVAWRALDAYARLTLNELVRMSLAGQPLPEAFLALETLKAGTGTALDSLSGMLTGWPLSNRICGDACTKSIATPTQHEKDSGAAAHEIYTSIHQHYKWDRRGWRTATSFADGNGEECRRRIVG
jgi:hypothetical protein